MKPKPDSKIKKAIVVSQLRRGDVIKCGACGLRHYEVMKHVIDGEVLRACDLIPVSPAITAPEDGQLLVCQKCSCALYVGNYEQGFGITVEDKKDDGKRYKTLRAPD